MNAGELKSAMQMNGSAIARLPGDMSNLHLFTNPETISSVRSAGDIPGAFETIDAALSEKKHVFANFAFEAFSAFDPAMPPAKPSAFPLLCFAVYPSPPQKMSLDFFPALDLEKILFAPDIGKEDYLRKIERIKRLIFEGDTYQVNFTIRLLASPIHDPETLFLHLASAHSLPYPAFFRCNEYRILSLSPELFLEKIGRNIQSRPMKGTSARLPDPYEDLMHADDLSKCPKNRAENVMIADMVRNDMGRICEPGSIRTRLFEIETYPTLRQMSSSVEGILHENCSSFEIFRALFPPASICGAPKIRTLEIIGELESSPRKIYTGCMGCLLPGGDFLFNVAIRTILSEAEKTELGVGGGIVADSEPESEWSECILKSNFANCHIPKFKVLESILYDADRGFVNLEEHLSRMRISQIYFGRKWREQDIRDALDEARLRETAKFAKVRLLLCPDGSPEIESVPLESAGWGKSEIRICFSSERTRRDDPFLHNKTSNRSLYDKKFSHARADGFDEIIFLNLEGELTEGAISNIFIRKGEVWLTPPSSCGLLKGIWRAECIKTLDALERPILPEELLGADEILVGNSVRGGSRVLASNISN